MATEDFHATDHMDRPTEGQRHCSRRSAALLGRGTPKRWIVGIHGQMPVYLSCTKQSGDWHDSSTTYYESAEAYNGGHHNF